MSKEKAKMKLLFELIKGARRSDRELAKTLGMSQPTVTRKRTKLERDGYIQEYTAIPDTMKIGYEIAAFTLLAFREPLKEEALKKAREWTRNHPNVVFAADGEGMGMNSIILSVHKNYASYSKLVASLREDWQPNLQNLQSFLVSLNRPELMIKAFSFRYLEKIKD